MPLPSNHSPPAIRPLSGYNGPWLNYGKPVVFALCVFLLGCFLFPSRRQEISIDIQTLSWQLLMGFSLLLIVKDYAGEVWLRSRRMRRPYLLMMLPRLVFCLLMLSYCVWAGLRLAQPLVLILLLPIAAFLSYVVLERPNWSAAYEGLHRASDMWRRVTAGATFDQASYEPGASLLFSYRDRLSRRGGGYRIWLQKITEVGEVDIDGHHDRTRRLEFSDGREVNAARLHEGVRFSLPTDDRLFHAPKDCLFSYWEIALEAEADGFRERFLLSEPVERTGYRRA